MKNVHERAREGRLAEAFGLFSKAEVRSVKSAGISKQDFLRLCLANEIATSLRLARDYFETLLYSGKITSVPASELSGEILYVPSSEVRALSEDGKLIEEEARREAERLLGPLGQK